MLLFKAIQLDPVSKQRTGREHPLEVETRREAIDGLLTLLGATRDAAHIDPTRTLIEVNAQLWTIVGFPAPRSSESPSQRRAGAKHKRVR
ncbi:MAG: hypothetical protein ACR2IK_15870 [Chloroflexota bacterium]